MDDKIFALAVELATPGIYRIGQAPGNAEAIKQCSEHIAVFYRMLERARSNIVQEEITRHAA